MSIEKTKVSDEAAENIGVKNDDIDWILRDPNVVKSQSVSVNGSVASHLTTNISNSNDHVSSKTRPSIGTIQEGEILTPKPGNSGHDSGGGNGGGNDGDGVGTENGTGTVTDTASTTNFSTRKRGSSLSSISSLGSNTSHRDSSSGLFGKLKGKFYKSPPSSPQLNATGSNSPAGSIFKYNYDLKLKKTDSNVSNDHELSRSISNPPSLNLSNTTTVQDPKLDKYIRYYSQPDSESRKSSFSDASTGCLLNPKPETEDSHSGSKISSFLRRRSNTSTLPLVSVATEFNRRSSESNVTSSQTSLSSTADTTKKDSSDANSEFNNLKPLKRVGFHSSTFLIDPPQQIPSRNPRKGNVEVLQNGSLKINPLSEEDKVAMEKSQRGQGGGIVVGGTGSLHHVHNDPTTPKTCSSNDDDDSNDIDKKAKKIAIDKPMVHNRSNSYSVPIEKMALDIMYTRCCHLREILPIPAILKQIPKNSMAPLPLIQLRNPTPSMIEIETFADFIRIAPIICISLDGVELSYEQFKILLSAMSAKSQLEKLSLRNTPINSDGWALLCWFLSRNTVLSKLDITQCPSLSIDTLKKRKKSSDDKTKKLENAVIRMECNRENRSDMNWSLFVATIIARGGIDELILTGCCITDLDVFEKLVKYGLSIKTSRLGLAYNNLHSRQEQCLIDHWLFTPLAKGLDFGYNDLLSSQLMKPLIEAASKPQYQKLISKSQLGFLSLNSTNMRFSESFKRIVEDFLMKLPNLKYFDLSNNPRLFGSSLDGNSKENDVDFYENSSDDNEGSKFSQEAITSYLTSKLPFFPKLIRLHFENNNLNPQSIISIARTLPFCKNLGYFSLLGNKLDTPAAAALVQAVKNSKRLITLDGDFDGLPSYFVDRLGIYTMRNMERTIYPTNGNEEDDNTKLTSKLNTILELKAKGELDLKSDLVKDFIQEATRIRVELHEAVNELHKLQLRKELNLEGKEALIRLLFVDSSITKGIQLIDTSLEPDTTIGEFRLAEHIEQPDPQPALENNENLGMLQKEFFHNSPSIISRASSRSSLNQLNKEEASVHKLHNSLYPDKEEEAESHEDFHSSGLSGEEIRKKITNVNLDQLLELTEYVKSLKRQGVPLSKIYESFSTQNDDDNDDSGGLSIHHITQKLKNLNVDNKVDSNDDRITNRSTKEKVNNGHEKDNKINIKHNGNIDRKLNNNHDIDSNSTPNTEEDTRSIRSDIDGEEINEVYDDVLNKIQFNN